MFYGIAPDDEQAIADLVHRAVQECDFVITNGGASAGDYDFVTALVRREGEVLFDRISMRPGKAITFGLLGGKPHRGFQAIRPRRMWALRCSLVRRSARCAALPRVASRAAGDIDALREEAPGPTLLRSRHGFARPRDR
ncbi:MAG: molybdopterin-binding protein [Collinsella sp.]